jgi:hypothetical protein
MTVIKTGEGKIVPSFSERKARVVLPGDQHRICLKRWVLTVMCTGSVVDQEINESKARKYRCSGWTLNEPSCSPRYKGDG